MMNTQSAFHMGETVVAIFPWTEDTTLEDICNNHFHEGVITDVITRPTGTFIYRVSGTKALIPEDRLTKRENN